MTTFDLNSIKPTHKQKPPRLVIHGVHGVGKTTFAAGANSPIVVRTEDGLGTLQVPAFPLATDYMNVLEALQSLANGDHKYRTCIIDSLDWLEPLVWAQTCRARGVTNIEDFGYGKGYMYAEDSWSLLLDEMNKLRARGMTVILIAHSEIKRFDAPDTEPYDRYQPKLHKGASALVQEWADVVGFAHYEIFTQDTDVGFNKKVRRGAATGRRLLSAEERPAFVAKNRYGLPAEMDLDWQTFSDTLRSALRAATTQNGNGTTPPTEPATTQSTEELAHA